MDLLRTLVFLSILIFVHEIGHFLAAKRAGIRVEEFGFGLPPRLFGKKIGETIYSLNLLPIGGFVRLFGEEEVDACDKEKSKAKTSLRFTFFAQSKRVRAAVVTAGVIMNFLFGVVIFAGIFSVLGIPAVARRVQIVGIVPGSPAASAFELGDEIVAVGGKRISKTDEFKSLVDAKKGEEVRFVILRNLKRFEVSAVPRLEPPKEEGSLGVVISPMLEYLHYPSWQMPFRGVWYGLQEAYYWGLNIVQGLFAVLRQAIRGTIPKDIGGPLELHFLFSEASKAGLVPQLQLLAILSVNLAIINLFPFPALDGGRLLFIGVEAVSGRKIKAKVEQAAHTIGMVILLALMLAITVQDILRHFSMGNIVSFFERVVRM